MQGVFGCGLGELWSSCFVRALPGKENSGYRKTDSWKLSTRPNEASLENVLRAHMYHASLNCQVLWCVNVWCFLYFSESKGILYALSFSLHSFNDDRRNDGDVLRFKVQSTRGKPHLSRVTYGSVQKSHGVISESYSHVSSTLLMLRNFIFRSKHTAVLKSSKVCF